MSFTKLWDYTCQGHMWIIHFEITRVRAHFPHISSITFFQNVQYQIMHQWSFFNMATAEWARACNNKQFCQRATSPAHPTQANVISGEDPLALGQHANGVHKVCPIQTLDLYFKNCTFLTCVNDVFVVEILDFPTFVLGWPATKRYDSRHMNSHSDGV